MLSHEAPFDAIHVGAAADELHQILLDKLALGGRMVIPVGPHYSYQVRGVLLYTALTCCLLWRTL